MCRVTRELPPAIQLPSFHLSPPVSIATLNPSTSHSVTINTADNRLEKRDAIVSRGSTVYEIGPILREGKFGSIRIASVLKPAARENEFERCLERPVALKTYSMEQINDIRGNAVENPWLEIEIQQLIGNKHPNLVGILETCIIQNTLFIVLPYFRGGDMFDVIETRYNGQLPVSQSKKMFQQILSGLLFLHNQGIAHRDLSLENILYDDETNTFAICDFGMALRVLRDPETQAFLPLANAPVCGKDGYIAPELWRREPTVDLYAADVWSMGVMLFMVLTGSAPMQRATEWDPYYQLISNNRLMDLFCGMSLDSSLSEGLMLVQTILNPISQARPSAAQLLSNGWLQEM
jgi:serine/threonine protein kinase